MLIFGGIGIPVAGHTLLANANIFGFFLGMMALSTLAEIGGFFEWASTYVARWSKGNVRYLFIGVMLLGCCISTILSNDATALILTPIVLKLIKRLGIDPLPFMFGCVFIADTASFILPVSNPINIIILTSVHLSLFDFLKLLLLPSLVVIALNISIFLWLFRTSLAGTFTTSALTDPYAFVPNRQYFRWILIVLGGVAIAYIICSAAQIPLAFVAMTGAILLLVGALVQGTVTLPQLSSGISWPIFGFIVGMAIVVQGVERTGLIQSVGDILLQHVSSTSPSYPIIGATVFGTAVGSNISNNIPMAVVMTSLFHQLGSSSHALRQSLIGATILGCDLGANLTTIGSLAKVFWLLLLRREGIHVSSLDYAKIGILVTPILLVAGSVILWLMVRLFA